MPVLNGYDFELFQITLEELNLIRKSRYPAHYEGFNQKEQTALEYALRLSGTPPDLDESFQNLLKTVFTDREIVVLSVTISQVNYWTRLVQGFNVPSAGFTQDCSLSPTPKK